MKLAAYIRVSTEGQVDAFGKDVQLAAIMKWAGLNGHIITGVFEEDAVSGKVDSGDRPVLRMLLDKAKRLPGHYEGIVALDATRLARRLLVQETLIALVRSEGLRVFTTTAGEMGADDDDPTRILIRQILGVIAEFDHRTTVNRLHGGRMAKAAQGGYIGGVAPYGLAVVGTGKSAQFVPDPVESEVVREILLRHSNGESLRSIAGALNLRRVPTKTGKNWAATQISDVVKRNGQS